MRSPSDAGQNGAPAPSGEPAARPHYHGHRKRLRERLINAGADALPDYEILELVLSQVLVRIDVKPLTKACWIAAGIALP